ncbi:MAG: DUF1638 domain-containing protein [Burkholderiales bacterium]|nr:DUF1638 domain-containing protein [Burkholderiales bacterium]
MPDCLLLGCGILKREVRHLIDRNCWKIETDFLPPALHVDLDQLGCALREGLGRHPGRNIVVFYGNCHPEIDDMLGEARAFRTRGQNCIEMLLGRERFMTELSQGAFFLLEELAKGWDEAIGKTFGNRMDVAMEVFRESCSYFLCIRTPCSADYSDKAEEISEKTGLPLRWVDVGLDHLEAVLKETFERSQAVISPATPASP